MLLPLALNVLSFVVQDSLCVLNVSGTNIDDIGDLGVLRKLQHFSAADNKLQQVAVKTTFDSSSTRESGEHSHLVDGTVLCSGSKP